MTKKIFKQKVEKSNYKVASNFNILVLQINILKKNMKVFCLTGISQQKPLSLNYCRQLQHCK